MSKTAVARRYRVVRRTSTRRSLNPKAAGYAQWVNFEPGTTVSRWPAHAPVDEWVAIGNWIPAEEKP